MKNKRETAYVIIRNNRFDNYERLLNLAREEGYTICSMLDFYNEKESERKHLILRHDIDHISKGTIEMINRELELGVESTYYFRWTTIDKPVLELLVANQFDIGLHYETIASYISHKRIKKIHNMGEYSEVICECKELLKTEIGRFRREYYPQLTSISSHGAHINRKFHISNNVLVEDENKDYYGILFEAYVKYVDCYIMDANIRYNNGYAYNQTPEIAIQDGFQNILLLTHPEHWYYSFFSKIYNIVALAAGRYKNSSEKTFCRIMKYDSSETL